MFNETIYVPEAELLIFENACWIDWCKEYELAVYETLDRYDPAEFYDAMNGDQDDVEVLDI